MGNQMGMGSRLCSKNGKYYFYYPTDANNIGVAISDRPYGPFKDPINKPVITKQSQGVVSPRDFIDPCVFIDDDSRAYLFMGQKAVNAVELNEDMVSYKPGVKIIQGINYFFEASWVHKYKDKYYFHIPGWIV
ncbi:MAG: family 43 glycosylhydrolase [Bacteroidales bacterium]|nr:family 43 glycosylhydrolase [Bacteroidales bacterium]